jgi:hypothetical protein
MRLGIVYVNTAHANRAYIREAEVSVASFRRFIPDAEYILCTDDTSFVSDVFDTTIYADFTIPDALQGTDHKNGQMVGKLAVLQTLDHDRVMYLGADTYAFQPEIASVFDILDTHDIAVAHAPFRIHAPRPDTPLATMPRAYPEFNCDLVAWRKSDAMSAFLKEWERLYREHAFGHPHDQGAFRYLAYHSDLRIATLPEEYNYRGDAFRADTVVLQNREALPKYFGWRRKMATGWTRLTRLTGKIKRRLVR